MGFGPKIYFSCGLMSIANCETVCFDAKYLLLSKGLILIYDLLFFRIRHMPKTTTTIKIIPNKTYFNLNLLAILLI